MSPSVRASGALAFRRSTAVLAAPDTSGHRLSAQSRASWDPALRGVTPFRLSQSTALRGDRS